MRDVFICDAVRTPIGRFGGSLAKVRADDLAAVPIKALMARTSQARLGAGRRGVFRLRQPGRRGQPQRRAHGAAAGGPAGIGSRPDAQSALRLRPRCGRRRRPRDPRRRDRFRHCRRRRIDDARAVRDGQGAGSVLALGRDLRHHHRLALHQSADEGSNTASMRCRRPARTSPRNSRSRAPTRTRSRSARSSAPVRRSRRGYFAEEIAPVSVPGGKAGPITVDKDEHPRPETTLEGLAKLKPIVPQSRHGDRGQCVRRQ